MNGKRIGTEAPTVVSSVPQLGRPWLPLLKSKEEESWAKGSIESESMPLSCFWLRRINSSEHDRH